MLEVRVRDRAQPIVLKAERPAHDVPRSGIVESGEQDQRTEAHVRVRVRFDCLEERGNCERGLGTACGPRGRHAFGEIHGPELLDRRGKLRRRDHLARIFRRCSRRGRSLVGGRRRDGLLSGQRDDGHQQEHSNAERPHCSYDVYDGCNGHDGQSTTFNASWRYACSSRGNASG